MWCAWTLRLKLSALLLVVAHASRSCSTAQVPNYLARTTHATRSCNPYDTSCHRSRPPFQMAANGLARGCSLYRSLHVPCIIVSVCLAHIPFIHQVTFSSKILAMSNSRWWVIFRLFSSVGTIPATKGDTYFNRSINNGA